MLTLVAFVVFPALMAYAAASDLLTMTIPNRITLALIAAFLAFAGLSGMGLAAFGGHLAAGAAVLAVAFALFSFGWIGGGDAKLAAATALWLGFGSLLDYLYLSAIGGAVLTIALLALRGMPLPGFALGWTWLARLHDKRSGVPYGIALAGAALAVFPDSALFALLAG